MRLSRGSTNALTRDHFNSSMRRMTARCLAGNRFPALTLIANLVIISCTSFSRRRASTPCLTSSSNQKPACRERLSKCPSALRPTSRSSLPTCQKGPFQMQTGITWGNHQDPEDDGAINVRHRKNPQVRIAACFKSPSALFTRIISAIS